MFFYLVIAPLAAILFPIMMISAIKEKDSDGKICFYVVLTCLSSLILYLSIIYLLSL